MSRPYRTRFLILPAFVLWVFSFFVFAERLPFKNYSTADGLPSDSINKIFLDSKGFLWFCTEEGLSRFDGYRFKNYTQEEGLPHRNVNDILENPDGTYFLATSNGLALFNPRGRPFRWDNLEGKLDRNTDEVPAFTTYLPEDGPRPNRAIGILSLAGDPGGNVMVGMRDRLYRLRQTDAGIQFEKVEIDAWKAEPPTFNAMMKDSRSNLWLATSVGIYMISGSGDLVTLNSQGGNSIFEDRKGRIWVDSGGLDIGARIYEYSEAGSTPKLIETLTTKDGLALNGFSNAIAQTDDDRLFVVSDGKLFHFDETATSDGQIRLRQLDNDASQATADRSGNIWFTTNGKGVNKYTPNSFKIYDQRDGLSRYNISSIFGDRNGKMHFTVRQHELYGFADGKLQKVVLNGAPGRLWSDNYLDHQGSDGKWWVPTVKGLVRYPIVDDFRDLATTSPERIFTKADGLPNDPVFNIFEDSRGDIWITTPGNDASVARWDKATDTLHRYSTADGFPAGSGAISFEEDRSGNVWLGFYFGQLLRLKDGKVRSFTDEKLLPEGRILRIFLDSLGRIWLATASRGLFRVDDPDAETPVFQNVSTREGLSSSQALCMTEDKFGRLWIGTGRGIDRIDQTTGRIRTFSKADGLPFNSISYCYADADGTLWFASNNTLAEMRPMRSEASAPPAVLIDEITVNGNARNISEIGETEIKGLELASDERQVRISFLAISLASGESLRYQYRLDGQEWSEPTDERTVAFDLSPGNYEFAVKAINSDGVESVAPATAGFKILPPFWQRWSFLAIVLLLAGGAVFALDRFRVAKTRQVESALVRSQESEERFRTLADTASDAILTIDEESTIVFANEAIAKVFGYEPEEVIGKSMPMLMPEHMRPGHHAGIQRYISTRNKNINWSGVALPGLHKEGHEIPLEVSFGEFEREGKRYFTGIARDVTERKRAERELQEAREERFRELDRVRRRIATDLHDDIGSSLTQIAVLSEVARGQSANLDGDGVQAPLDRIKAVSKELVAVMSDIVWAINPQKDYLHDLVLRMRRFGSDLFSARGIAFDFIAPDVDEELQMGANIRREVFAIFKEAANNAVKYSECSAVRSEFSIVDGELRLRFEDDGKGFDTSIVLSDEFRPEMGGNGLVSMKKRAAELGGECEIRSAPDAGTSISVRIPLHSNISSNGGH